MAKLNYSFVGVNKDQLRSSIDNLRNSSSFRQVEADVSKNYDNVVVVMGPNITPRTDSGLYRKQAVSGAGAQDRRTLYIFLDTTTSSIRPTPSGELAMTVDQLIAHELGHATFRTQSGFTGNTFGGEPSPEQSAEEKAVVHMTDTISAELGLPGNTYKPQFADNPGPQSTFSDPLAANPRILRFANGARADVGYGPLADAPTFGGAIYGIKRLEGGARAPDESGDAGPRTSDDSWRQAILEGTRPPPVWDVIRPAIGPSANGVPPGWYPGQGIAGQNAVGHFDNWTLPSAAIAPPDWPAPTPAPAPPSSPSSQGPLTLKQAYEEYRARMNAANSQNQSVDPGAAPSPLAMPSPPTAPVALPHSAAGWFAEMTGLDPNDPTHPAAMPDEDQLQAFVGRQPIAPWTLQRR